MGWCNSSYLVACCWRISSLYSLVFTISTRLLLSPCTSCTRRTVRRYGAFSLRWPWISPTTTTLSGDWTSRWLAERYRDRPNLLSYSDCTQKMEVCVCVCVCVVCVCMCVCVYVCVCMCVCVCVCVHVYVCVCVRGMCVCVIIIS